MRHTSPETPKIRLSSDGDFNEQKSMDQMQKETNDYLNFGLGKERTVQASDNIVNHQQAVDTAVPKQQAIQKRSSSYTRTPRLAVVQQRIGHPSH